MGPKSNRGFFGLRGAHLVGIPPVIAHELEALVGNVLRGRIGSGDMKGWGILFIPVLLSPDGKLLGIADKNKLRILEVTNWKQILSIASR
jgi:hypothetical protein